VSSPPSHVLGAFGALGFSPVPLAGGQGTSWRAGALVFKPANADQDELTWRANLYPQVHCDEFRLPAPRYAADGSLSVDGWCASEFVAGRYEQGRWAEIVAAGERFHNALSGMARPQFLDRRTSRWAISDRVAWDEMPASDFAEIRYLTKLTGASRPVTARSQLIHGDLCGNLLF
jgi:hypothetical protein